MNTDTELIKKEETLFKEHFDKLIVNDDLQKACAEATVIINHFIHQ